MDKSTFEKLRHNLVILDTRLTKIGLRMGLAPCQTDYELVDDKQMVDNLTYVALPVHRQHWRYGKQAMQDRGNYHVFECVINTKPSLCYLGTTNDLAMQLLVMAHAKWGHVDFFTNNRLFGESRPESAIERFAQAKRFVDRLIADPDWGYDNMEYWVDAAHAIENYSGWLPTPERKDEKELREEYMAELRRLTGQYERTVIEADKKELERQIRDMNARLKCHPLVPSNDLLGFLIDPKNTPHLPEKARTLLEIVRDENRYFQPQGRTKFMNEGWASYWEKHCVDDPEMNLPIDMRFDLAKYWTMHDRQAINWYFDPYALGLAVFNYIDEKYGYDDGEETVTSRPLTVDEEGFVREAEEEKTYTVVKRNRDKMMEVRRTYDDVRFMDEFLNEELFEKLNDKALKWVRRLMERINLKLLRERWNPQMTFSPLPETLEGLMEVLETWLNLAENTQHWHQFVGTPVFPVPAQLLQEMAHIIQVIAAFDEDKHKARRQLVYRVGYSSLPNITIVDTGRFTDGVWTLRHEYDPTFGPLLQSEARLTLRYFRRLCGAPVRLLTKELMTDWRGRPYGDPVPFEYFTEDGDTVKERYL